MSDFQSDAKRPWVISLSHSIFSLLYQILNTETPYVYIFIYYKTVVVVQNISRICIHKKKCTTHKKEKPQNKQINNQAFAKNRCSARSPVHEPMSLLSYNMKFLVSCSHRGASKTPFAFIDFLPAPCICVSCSCWGEIGSLFIVFIHFISTAVLTEGPFGFSPTHTQTIYYGQAGVSERGQGTGALVHDFVDTMNSRSEKAISYDTSPPKLPPSEFPTRLNELLSGRVQTEVHKRKFCIESSGKIRKFAYAINDKKNIFLCAV